MKIGAVIKASSISRHFPERYRVKINGTRLLSYIVQRLAQSSYISSIVLATSDDEIDDRLCKEAANLNIGVYRGKYEDSIGRLHGAAKVQNVDLIVKVLGNYPLVDPAEIDHLVAACIDGNYTFAYNEHYHGIILGLGAEVFSGSMIRYADRKIDNPVHRRFGSRAFKDILDPERILSLNYPKIRPNYRVTLAVPEDVFYVNKIVAECGVLSYEGIVQYLDDNPLIPKYAQQNIAGSKEVGAEKLLLFPEKIKTLVAQPVEKPDPTYPISVELSFTDRCNLSCKYCSDEELRKRSNSDISFERIEVLIKDLAENGTRGIVIEGGGEPTLFKRFNDIVKTSIKHGLHLGLITNGVLLPYQQVLNSFDWIRISLDAANREQYLKIKGRDYFETVLKNIEILVQQKKNVVIGVGYVLTNENETSIEDLVLRLRKMGVDYIQFRPVIDHPELMPQNKDLSYLEKHATQKFSINIHNMKENVIQGNLSLACSAHSLSSVITSNGDVYLCGRLNKYHWLEPIGNLNANSFKEIWTGETRRKQSQMVADEAFCRKWCPECRMTKYNVLLEDTMKIKTKHFI